MPNAVPEIDARTLLERLRGAEPPLLVDVREPWEAEIASIGGARLIPLGELADRIGELEPFRARPVVIHCRTGGRSRRACELLLDKGFTRVENLAGGIDGWSREVDPAVPRY